MSNREANTLLYLSLGYSVNRMEETLRITVSTVAAHSRSIRKNMDLHNKQEGIDIADEIMASRTESQNPRCFDARPPSARQYPAEPPQI